MTTVPWDFHQVYPSPCPTLRNENGKVNHHHREDRFEFLERPGRRVHFNSIVKTDSSIHFITNEEEQAIWYSSKELRDLSYKERDLVLTAKQLGHEDNNEEFCLRGLETTLSRRAALEQRARRVSIVKAVLFEQNDGPADPAQIRKKSLAISKESRQIAALYGIQDAEAVASSDKPDESSRDRLAVFSGGSIFIDHETRTIRL